MSCDVIRGLRERKVRSFALHAVVVRGQGVAAWQGLPRASQLEAHSSQLLSEVGFDVAQVATDCQPRPQQAQDAVERSKQLLDVPGSKGRLDDTGGA